jgi:hypothetical protein
VAGDDDQYRKTAETIECSEVTELPHRPEPTTVSAVSLLAERSLFPRPLQD